MPLQTHISFPLFSLTSKALHESAFKKLKMEPNRKHKINKEMVTDMLMLASLFVTPVLLALLI